MPNDSELNAIAELRRELLEQSKRILELEEQLFVLRRWASKLDKNGFYAEESAFDQRKRLDDQSNAKEKERLWFQHCERLDQEIGTPTFKEPGIDDAQTKDDGDC